MSVPNISHAEPEASVGTSHEAHLTTVEVDFSALNVKVGPLIKEVNDRENLQHDWRKPVCCHC